MRTKTPTVWGCASGEIFFSEATVYIFLLQYSHFVCLFVLLVGKLTASLLGLACVARADKHSKRLQEKTCIS